MTNGDGSEVMDMFRSLGERQLDDLFAGRAPETAPELDSLATLLGDLRRFETEVPTRVAAMHIAAAAAEADHHQSHPMPAPPHKAGRSRRPVPVLTTLLSTLLGKVVVGAAATTFAMSGAAAVGALPDSVQSVFADVSGVFPGASDSDSDSSQDDDTNIEADDDTADAAEEEADRRNDADDDATDGAEDDADDADDDAEDAEDADDADDADADDADDDADDADNDVDADDADDDADDADDSDDNDVDADDESTDADDE